MNKQIYFKGGVYLYGLKVDSNIGISVCSYLLNHTIPHTSTLHLYTYIYITRYHISIHLLYTYTHIYITKWDFHKICISIDYNQLRDIYSTIVQRGYMVSQKSSLKRIVFVLKIGVVI